MRRTNFLLGSSSVQWGHQDQGRAHLIGLMEEVVIKRLVDQVVDVWAHAERRGALLNGGYPEAGCSAVAGNPHGGR